MTSAKQLRPDLYLWHPAAVTCAPIRKALSARHTLQTAAAPQDACTAARGLLLYEAPEQALYRMLGASTPDIDTATADWCRQARQILKACEGAEARCTLAEISAAQASPAAFAAHFDLPPPQDETAPPARQDPLRMLLARSLVASSSDMETLAAQLARRALPLPPTPAAAAAAEQNLPMAAVRAYLDVQGGNDALRQQIALLMDQKIQLQAELETLEQINQDTTEEARNRLAGKEKALQTLGQELRSSKAQNTELQNARNQSRTRGRYIARIKASRFYRALRSMGLRDLAKRDDRLC